MPVGVETSLKRGVISGHKEMFTDPKGTTHEKMFLPSNDDVPSRIGLSVSSMPGRHLRHHFDRKCCIKNNSQEYRKYGPNSYKSVEMQFECNACGKSLNQRHMRIHNGEKSFKCTNCGQAFKMLWNLNKCQKPHPERKVFKCEECGKAYRQETNLVQHQKTHTKEKTYKYEACGKALS